MRVPLELDINIIGDIWVNVDIEFKPMMHPRGMEEQLHIAQINNYLHQIAGELKCEIRDSITEKLREDSREPASQKKEKPLSDEDRKKIDEVLEDMEL